AGRHNWFEHPIRGRVVLRIDTGAELYEADRAPYIVPSGATLDGSSSETRMMSRRLEDRDISKDAILIEDQAHNTYENGVYTVELMKEHGFDSVLVVTSAVHMPRSMAVFEKLGVKAIAAPVPRQITIPDN